MKNTTDLQRAKNAYRKALATGNRYAIVKAGDDYARAAAATARGAAAAEANASAEAK